MRRTYRQGDSRWPDIAAPVLVVLVAVSGGAAAVLILLHLLG